jgi:hypothetical protein
MIGRKSVLGILALCALAFSAFAAPNASAEQRAFTCTKAAKTKTFHDAHCLDSKTTPFEYGHELIAEGVETEITATSAKTAAGTTAGEVSKLKGALSGVVTEVQCKTVHGIGHLKNGPSSVSGTGILTYSECEVTLPAGKGCKVTGGKVETKNLAATTAGQAANQLLFKPNAGTEFASIPIEGCSIPALNNTFPVTGELTATTSGATTTTKHETITTQNKLKFGGVKAGLEGAITISMNEAGNKPGEAIVLT